MSGKTPEEIAFELVAKLKGMGVWGERNMPDILDMYAECLDAAQGKRKYIPGRCIMEPADKAKLDALHKAKAQQAQHPQQAQQQRAPQAQPQAQAQHAQMQRAPQPHAAAPAQPVHQQQQMVQQAFKQG
ncbi:MAG: hypothetical protein ABJ275_03530 [Maricaulaceae bacterium]